MKFIRPKKLIFCNNKGGVGKTTLAFNCAVKFSQRGYKTVLVDLDPQCNLTLQSLGSTFYEDNLFSGTERTIYDVLKPKIDGSGDIDFSVEPRTVRENLSIIPGDLRLSVFEDLLISGFANATGGNMRGYSDTSSIQRYLDRLALENGVDIFIIDTSPSLGILNRIIFLGGEYFVVPMTSDSFSAQGIENLGKVFEEWKRNWKNTALAVAGSTPNDYLLKGDSLFVGYIINSFNVYKKRVVKRQEEWVEKIPARVKEFLSEKHCRNGLVEASWKKPLSKMQDYGQLTAISMENGLSVCEFGASHVNELNLQGTKELYEKACGQLEELVTNLEEILLKY